MKSPIQLLMLAAVVVVGGCTALVPDRPPEQDARVRLDRGLAALDAGMYSEAFRDLAWVYTHCPAREAGTHALVALASLELDPRNDMARPAVATELLGRVIRTSDAPAWVRPLAETSYLTALALGAPPADPQPPAGHPVDGANRGEVEHAAGEPAPADSAHTDPLLHEDEDEVDPALVVTPPAPDAEPVYGCGRVVTEERWAAPALPTLPGPSLARLLAEAEARRATTAARADTLQSRLASVTQQLEATQAELERIRRTLKP